MNIHLNELGKNHFEVIEYENDEVKDRKISKVTYVKFETDTLKLGFHPDDPAPKRVFEWLQSEEHKFLYGTDTVEKLKTITISDDNRTWKELQLDYHGFEEKFSDCIHSLIEKNKECGSLSCEWLDGYELRMITLLFMRQGSIAEDWYKMAKRSFCTINDQFWNSHYIHIDYHVYGYSEGVGLTIQYTDDFAEQTEYLEDNKELYHVLLKNALSSLGTLSSGEEILLEYPERYSWFPGYASYVVYRKIAEELKKLNGDLIRKDGKMFVKHLE